jgi:predicted NBD/HSP70 family sugar kinase
VQALGVPVLVENDATAAAVAERLHGVARARRTFAFVLLGRGLGLGLVLDGAPFKGAFGNAGELGHVVAVPGGRPCPCGNRGCLERYVSLHALAEMLAEAGLALADPAALVRLLAAHDPALRGWLDQAAGLLRPVVTLLENLIDPETIVIGGVLPDPVLDALIARLEPLLPSVAARADRTVPRLLRGATGRFTPALGAAALPLFHEITPDLAAAAAPARAAGRNRRRA